MSKPVIDVETNLYRRSPAGKFCTYFQGLYERSKKLLDSTKTDAQTHAIETHLYKHMKYLNDHMSQIVDLLTAPQGQILSIKCRKTEDDRIQMDIFEKCTNKYGGKRRQIDMFFRELNELYSLE